MSISFDPDNFTCGSLASRLGVPYHIARAIVAAGISAGKIRVEKAGHGNSRRLSFCHTNKRQKDQDMMVIGGKK